jgi:hypothetical protein
VFREHGIQEIVALPVAQHEIVGGAFHDAISTTFLTGALITVLVFAIVLFLPEHPLRSGRPGGSDTSTEPTLKLGENETSC